MLSHNDLLANNILISESIDEKIHFIDYEYASYNYRTYDIADYFTETKEDYKNLFKEEDID